MRVNIKKIAIWTCAAALICGFKYIDYEAQKHIAYAEQFVNPIGQVDRNGNAPTAMEAKANTESNNNSITFEANLSSRSNEDAERNAKRINANLANGLRNKGKVYVAAGIIENVNPFLLASISKHETGNGTSKVFKEKNNVAGMMINGVTFRRYSSVDESIFAFAKLIRENYIDKGKYDLEAIGNMFCPIGVANDPTNLNKHWIPNVTKIYMEMTEGMK